MANNFLYPNCCCLTGNEIFEANIVYPLDHPVAGYPKSIGRLTDKDACRVTLLLVDGSHTTVSICGRAITDLPNKLVELWKNMRSRYQYFHSVRKYIFGKKRDDKKYLMGMRATMRCIVNNPPIYILGIQPWKDLVDGYNS